MWIQLAHDRLHGDDDPHCAVLGYDVIQPGKAVTAGASSFLQMPVHRLCEAEETGICLSPWLGSRVTGPWRRRQPPSLEWIRKTWVRICGSQNKASTCVSWNYQCAERSLLCGRFPRCAHVFVCIVVVAVCVLLLTVLCVLLLLSCVYCCSCLVCTVVNCLWCIVVVLCVLL